jgi:hypothetical protein
MDGGREDLKERRGAVRLLGRLDGRYDEEIEGFPLKVYVSRVHTNNRGSYIPMSRPWW